LTIKLPLDVIIPYKVTTTVQALPLHIKPLGPPVPQALTSFNEHFAGQKKRDNHVNKIKIRETAADATTLTDVPSLDQACATSLSNL
jgi:hypothetical protein